ncbi:MAG: hypothetical protein NC131_01030 [Roseburia sp.]|nr:hypothetical protein [Roseburia sp.]
MSKYTTHKQILIAQDTARALPCIVSKTGVTVNTDGDYIVKAGTPLYGADFGTNRDTPLTVSGSGESVKAQGVLYQDVTFENGATTANGTLVYDGTVDLLKLDASVQTLITTTVKTALTNVQFVKGRAD